jgi:hypothetical protein
VRVVCAGPMATWGCPNCLLALLALLLPFGTATLLSATGLSNLNIGTELAHLLLKGVGVSCVCALVWVVQQEGRHQTSHAKNM